MRSLVVSHPSAENENGSTASLLSARFYIEQVHARHRHRACRRRRSTRYVYALRSYFCSWTKNSGIYRERRTSWWSLPKCASRYTVPHPPYFLSSCFNGMQNITFISNLTKFKVVPPHIILHMFKVCIDDFYGTNIDNLALLLEGCGRFLLRNDETKQRFGTMASHVTQSAMSDTDFLVCSWS